MADLETVRSANIAAKQQLLNGLKLNSAGLTGNKRQSKANHTILPRKKQRLTVPVLPERASARIASSAVRPSYKEDTNIKYEITSTGTKSRAVKVVKHRPELHVLEEQSKAVDADVLQNGWKDWKVTAKPPTRDEYGTFRFEDAPSFLPNKSPEEMLREGVFGGSYFRPLRSKRLGIVVEDDWKELPSEWIEGLNVSTHLINSEYDADINKYKAKCGQSIEEWEAAGWIAHEFDIRGWFQWFCRFYQGRRCEDDDRQISRWSRCVGEKGRWKRALLTKYRTMGVRHVFDDGEDEETKEVSPVIHQTCLQWAIEITQHDLDALWDP